MTEDEIVEWHHQLQGHEFEQTLGDSERQGNLVCHSSWGHKESDMTEQLNNNQKMLANFLPSLLPFFPPSLSFSLPPSFLTLVPLSFHPSGLKPSECLMNISF